jgi:hypothetical protein
VISIASEYGPPPADEDAAARNGRSQGRRSARPAPGGFSLIWAGPDGQLRGRSRTEPRSAKLRGASLPAVAEAATRVTRRLTRTPCVRAFCACSGWRVRAHRGQSVRGLEALRIRGNRAPTGRSGALGRTACAQLCAFGSGSMRGPRSWSLAALGVCARILPTNQPGGSACPSCTSIPYMSK